VTAAVSVRSAFVALAGNPNVGKSSLFNGLTGLRQRVANYPGVTVEKTEGEFREGGRAFRVIDLPGIYSLVPRSPDEQVAAEVLAGRFAGETRPDVIVVVLEASRLRRGLFLLSQILDLDLPVVVALNMNDEARRAGNPVDPARLSAALGGLPVVETTAHRAHGLDRLRAAVAAGGGRPAESSLWRRTADLPAGVECRWSRLRAADPTGDRGEEVLARYRWAGEVHQAVGAAAATPRPRSDAADRILLHPALGFLIFLAVMTAVFQAVFSWASPGTEWIEGRIAWLKESAAPLFPEGAWRDLVADGVIEGVGSVLVFLPQILILFFFLGILEDTGYMSRAAFIVDRPLRALGLSGRAFIPLLSSYACAVPGIIATRTIEDRRERLLTVLVAPLMTCSARLPVYTLLVGAFVPPGELPGGIGRQGAALTALYVGGALAGSLAALVIGKFVLKDAKQSPVFELPPYRSPSLGTIFHRLRHRAGAFLVRAGTLIFAVAVVMWALAYFPRHEPEPGTSPQAAAAAQLQGSYAGSLGRAIEPLVAPLGFDWKVGVGLVASFAAREVFVATMGVVYAVGGDAAEDDPTLVEAFRHATDDRTGRRVFDPPTVAALLAFYVIAPQCVSTLAIIRRETGRRRWAAFALVYLTLFAYAAAFLASRLTAFFS
jgi:ferrous iron transport protein B